MTRSLREQSQGLCLPLHRVYPSQPVTQYGTSVFMAQGAINHISKNKNKFFGGCRRERRGAACSVCFLQGMIEPQRLQIRACLPVCLPFDF